MSESRALELLQEITEKVEDSNASLYQIKEIGKIIDKLEMLITELD